MTAPKPFPRPALEILGVPAEAIKSLLAVWQLRPCWICGKNAWCSHREPRVELAEMQALKRRLRAVRG